MSRKRRSKRLRDLIQSVIFFIATFGVITSLIIYLWVYTEIDETLLAIEIQNSTASELTMNCKNLKVRLNLLAGLMLLQKGRWQN